MVILCLCEHAYSCVNNCTEWFQVIQVYCKHINRDTLKVTKSNISDEGRDYQ